MRSLASINISYMTHAPKLDPKLRESLVCPITKGPLVYDEAAGELISNAAKLAYRVREGMPLMLPAEARKLCD